MNSRSRTKNIVLISLTVALTTAGAYIRVPIPISPVPMSLQTLFVLLSGALLGPWLGAAAMASYVLLGLIGLPLFTGGGGPQYILSPTFGFLLSFPLSAMAVGLILKPASTGNGSGMGKKLAAMVVGSLVVYMVGIPCLWLNLLLVQGKELGLGPILMMGAVPFLPGDAIKSVLAALLAGPAINALDQDRSR